MKDPALISIFHGDNKRMHEAFQAWRQGHVNGFHMTEGRAGLFTIHWTQDKRENQAGRGCHHQGVSTNAYRTDKDSCYTTARKVCSNDLRGLIAWANEQGVSTKNCGHCDTRQFPFLRTHQR